MTTLLSSPAVREYSNFLRPTVEEVAAFPEAFRSFFDEHRIPQLDESALLPACSPLPQINGEGLSAEERATIASHSDLIATIYAESVPDASYEDLDRVRVRAATIALKHVLKHRPLASCCSQDELEPCEGCEAEGDAPRLSLAELIDLEANRMKARGNSAADLMASSLAELARVVRTVSADRPDQVEERVSILDAMFSEPEDKITDADVLLLTGSVG